jgi:hypothetical protein
MASRPGKYRAVRRGRCLARATDAEASAVLRPGDRQAHQNHAQLLEIDPSCRPSASSKSTLADRLIAEAPGLRARRSRRWPCRAPWAQGPALR